jgi:hypothetical protein
MQNRCDKHAAFSLLIEEDAVVAAAKAQAGERRLELLDTASLLEAIAINTAQNLHRSLSIYCAQIGLRLQ